VLTHGFQKFIFNVKGALGPFHTGKFLLKVVVESSLLQETF